MVYEKTPYSKLWDVNLEWGQFPRDVLLSCPPHVVEILEWGAKYSIKQHDPEWYAIRDNTLIVTGSILNSIVGENKYETREDTFLSKVWQHPSPFRGNAACEWGTLHEDEAYSKWCQREKVYGFTMGLIVDRDPAFQYRGGSLDGLDNRGRVIEIKCPLHRKIIPGKIPEYYYYQPQFYMYELGLTDAVFVQYKPEKLIGYELLDATEVSLDRPRMESVLDKAHTFAMEVIECRKTGVLPPEVKKRREWLVKQRFKKEQKEFSYDSVFLDTWEMTPNAAEKLYQRTQTNIDLNVEQHFLSMLEENDYEPDPGTDSAA